MNTYEKTVIKVSHIEENTNLLGPYNRFVIWVHGCCFDCDGCLAENTKKGSFEEIDVLELANRIIDSPCEGITISGGEPFLQPAALSKLLHIAKTEKDLGVIIYSGFTLDEINDDPDKRPLLGMTDILIDGRYEKSLDDGRAYVGSSNQKIHYLTERYTDVGIDYYSERKRRAEIKITPTQAILIGVPSKSVLSIWRDIKDKSGGMKNEF